MVPLLDLNEGEFGEVVEISIDSEHSGHGRHRLKGHGKRHKRCCERVCPYDLGIRIGKVVTLLQKPWKGSMLVKIGDSRFAIDREMAERIKIRHLN